MMILLLLMLVLAIGGDVLVTRMLLAEKERTTRLQAAAEKMVLNSGDDVLAYLEVNSVCHPQAKKMLDQLKALPAKGESTVKPQEAIIVAPVVAPEPVQTVAPPPAWLHDNTVRIPNEEQWELFLKDLRREEYDEDALSVLRHWVHKLGFKFTLAEQSIILDMFEDSDSRCETREIFAPKEKPAPVKKPAPTPVKTV